MLRLITSINIALLTEGAGMEGPRLQTSMNQGGNENVALKPDTIPADNHNPSIRLSTRTMPASCRHARSRSRLPGMTRDPI